jgi:hypothetical protein
MKKLLQMKLAVLIFSVMPLLSHFEDSHLIACTFDLECDDDNLCTDDWCYKPPLWPIGECRNDLRDCDDGIFCTLDFCIPDGGGCIHDEDDSLCDDGNPCSRDYCDDDAFGEEDQCNHQPDDTATCDDMLFCNGTETCGSGTCVHSGDPCSAGMFCNEINNSCDSTPPITSTTTTRTSTSTTTSIEQPTTSTTVQPLPDTYAISGYITGDIVEGVSILLSGTATMTFTTDIEGYYAFTELTSGYYNITPKMDGYSFAPPYHVIQNLTSNLYNMDFVSTKIPCVIEFICGDDAYEAEFLRNYRDSVLTQTPEGQELIRLYYQWSPVIVNVMEENEEFEDEVRELIDEVLELISETE